MTRKGRKHSQGSMGKLHTANQQGTTDDCLSLGQEHLHHAVREPDAAVNIGKGEVLDGDT